MYTFSMSSALPSYILIIIISLSPWGMTLASPLNSPYIYSLEDFEQHVILHKERIVALGLLLREEFPEVLGHIPPQVLAQFLQLHDNSKLLRSPRLLQMFDYDEAPILERLYKFYGQNKDDLTYQEQQELTDTVKQANRIDRLVANMYFQSQDFLIESRNPEADAQLLLRIERLLDVVDRGLDPTASEEFQRPMQRGSDFLTNEQDRQMARFLEQKYTELPSSYHAHNNTCASALLGPAKQ